MKRFTAIAVVVCALAQLLLNSCSNSQNFEAVTQDSVQLPFPEYTFTRSASATTQGCFFLATFSTRDGGDKHQCSVFILDDNGAIVWCRLNTSWSNFQMHDEGWMSYHSNGKYYMLDSHFELTDSVWCVNGAQTDAHELVWDYDTHHYLVIGSRTDTVDCSAMPRPERSVWRGSKRTAVKYGVIQELDEDNQLVWEWNSKDHFSSENMDRIFLPDSTKLDLPHLNSIDLDSAGNLLVSARYTHEVFYLLRQTDSIAWRMGGDRSDFTFVNDSLPFLGQHQVRWLNNGNILLYDNGYSYPGNLHNARAVEYKIDHQTKTATRVWSWSYPEKLIAESTGGVQRLYNGATLINFGKLFGRKPNVAFAVVNANDSIEIECSFKDTLASYRTYHWDQLVFPPDRPNVNLYLQDGSCSLGTTDNSAVLWSNGIVGNGIRIYKPGKYQCFRRNADGSYTGSDVVEVTQEMINYNGD